MTVFIKLSCIYKIYKFHLYIRNLGPWYNLPMTEILQNLPQMTGSNRVLFDKRAVGGAAPIYRGGALHRVWLRALSPVAKLQSIGGTLKRIIRKRILRPERAAGLHVGGGP